MTTCGTSEALSINASTPGTSVGVHSWHYHAVHNFASYAHDCRENSPFSECVTFQSSEVAKNPIPLSSQLRSASENASRSYSSSSYSRASSSSPHRTETFSLVMLMFCFGFKLLVVSSFPTAFTWYVSAMPVNFHPRSPPPVAAYAAKQGGVKA